MFDSGDIEEGFMGNVVSAGVGQSPARQALLGAGCPVETEATTINKGFEVLIIGKSMANLR